MKTIALMSLVILAALLLATTSQAAPSCCDPKQTQGQVGIFPSAPQAGSTFPVAPKNNYTQPMPQTTRAAAPPPRTIQVSQPATTYYPVPAAPALAISVNPPINPVAAASGPCGCGARFRAADYQVPSASCCGRRGLNVPQQAPRPDVSVPSCCAGRVKAAQPVSGCCAARPTTAGQAPPALRDTGRISYPLQAKPAVIQTGFQSNFSSATRIPASAASTLRFGNLW